MVNVCKMGRLTIVPILLLCILIEPVKGNCLTSMEKDLKRLANCLDLGNKESFLWVNLLNLSK